MITIPASKLLNAFEGGDIESIREDGKILVLINLRTVLAVPETPVPQVSKRPDNSVAVTSGDEQIATVQTESERDAEEITAWLSDLLAMSS